MVVPLFSFTSGVPCAFAAAWISFFISGAVSFCTWRIFDFGTSARFSTPRVEVFGTIAGRTAGFRVAGGGSGRDAKVRPDFAIIASRYAARARRSSGVPAKRGYGGCLEPISPRNRRASPSNLNRGVRDGSSDFTQFSWQAMHCARKLNAPSSSCAGRGSPRFTKFHRPARFEISASSMIIPLRYIYC